MRCLEKRRQKIEKQIFDKESELRELQVHLESMDINVPSLPTSETLEGLRAVNATTRGIEIK